MEGSNKYGPFWLQPEVTRGHVNALLFGSFMTIGLLTFIAITTPFVLTVGLNIPRGEQGAISGYLHVVQEIAALLAFGPMGLLADRIGRRQVYAAGLLFMGIGYALYGYATSVPEIVGYRVIYAIGVAAATAMLGTIIADYPENRSRGAMVAFSGVLNAVGINFIIAMGGFLPKAFVARGADQASAGHYTNLVIAGLCILTTVVLARGLRPGLPVHKAERPAFKDLIRRAIAEGRNPRVALAYASGFVMRPQLVILGTFTALWGTNAALQHGFSPSEALAKGRFVFLIPSAAGLLWQLCVMTWFLDRVNRVTGMVVSAALGVAGYMGTLLIEDPLSTAAMPLLILLGIGQISTFAAATTLISQEAPAEARGTVIAVFNMAGALGILLATYLGGQLFDSIHPSAPFAFVGALTFIVLILAIICRIKAPGEGVGRRVKLPGPVAGVSVPRS